jgi:hypothetical protein
LVPRMLENTCCHLPGERWQQLRSRYTGLRVQHNILRGKRWGRTTPGHTKTAWHTEQEGKRPHRKQKPDMQVLRTYWRNGSEIKIQAGDQ